MVPTLDGLPLIDAAEGLNSAVAFKLTEAPRDAAQVALDGWRVSVQGGSSYLVAQGPTMPDHIARVAAAMNAALQALDVLSARGGGDLMLDAPSEEHISAAGQAGTVGLRIMATQWFGFHLSATATVTDASGEIVPQQEPVVMWHPSMRYYRESQLAEDVFASTRSLWLGLENLLDARWPIQQGESEEKWLKRSLAAADKLINLRQFVPAHTSKEAHNAAYEYFYASTRTHLFHAKQSRGPLLPEDRSGINYLVARHDNLTRFYLALLEAETGVRRVGGAMTYAGFDFASKVWEESPELLATDDPEPVDVDATAVNPDCGTISTLAVTRDHPNETDGLKLFVGATHTLGLARLTKLGFRAANTLMSLHQISGDLQVAGVDHLEAIIALRLSNPGLPRTFPLV